VFPFLQGCHQVYLDVARCGGERDELSADSARLGPCRTGDNDSHEVFLVAELGFVAVHIQEVFHHRCGGLSGR
jgi:hypothetical protein